MSQTLETKTHYRADIQGLRGIAVLLVVVYHTGLALPGGFVGVDMFFVISGFVITQVLIREYEETGRIKLGYFYARRARRLIPALSTVTIFTLLISLVAMSPFGEQQQIIKTAIASTFFAGNIHLFAMNSYEALKDNPLRHLWSLGVEEQFYWVYPVFVLTLLRIARNQFINVLPIVLTAFAIVSFGFGVLLTYGFEFWYTESSVLSTRFAFLEKIGFQPGGDWPAKFAFFGAPARFWEILLGSLTALLANRTFDVKRTCAVSLTSVGIVLIILSSLALSFLSSFPGYLALMPTLGTVLLLAFNQQIKPVNKFLSSSWLVFFGDISYSLYLWHWPLVVFSRAIWPGTSFAPTVAAALSVIPALLSFKYIEKRFQKPKSEADLRTLRFTTVMMAVPLVLSFGFYRAANSGLGLVATEKRSDNFAAKLNNNCGEYQINFEVKCSVGPKDASILIYLVGDSNAAAASTGVAEAVLSMGGALVIATGSGCPFLATSPTDLCASFNKVRFKSIEKRKPDAVIIVNHQSDYLTENYHPWGRSENQQMGLSESLLWLDVLGVPAIVQGEIPFCDFKVNLLSRFSGKRKECWVNYDKQIEHLAFLTSTEQSTKRFKRHYFFDPRFTVCPDGLCAPFLNEKMVFVDRDHLSPSGSRLLTPIYKEAIEKVLEQP